MRKTALRDLKTAENLPHALKDWGHEDARVIVTSARTQASQKPYSFTGLKNALETDEQAYILAFGTGFGFTPDFIQSCYGILEPLRGNSADDYRHLSVRSAVSICLDRLLGS